MTGQAGISRIDTGRPHPARVYDYFLGGKNHYPVDEETARRILADDPSVSTLARANRGFMRRATVWLAAAGVRQYLDIGTGIPTEPNLHQSAQGVAPDARIVYVDNDPIVLRHAEALLRSTPEGVTDYIEADVRDPDRIMELAGEILDLSRPVALSLISLMHFVPDEQDAYGLVAGLVDRLAPGSYLVLSHASGDPDPEKAEKVVEAYRRGGVTLRPRSRAEVGRFFDGLELVEPGLVYVAEWQPGPAKEGADRGPAGVYAGVARKPDRRP